MLYSNYVSVTVVFMAILGITLIVAPVSGQIAKQIKDPALAVCYVQSHRADGSSGVGTGFNDHADSQFAYCMTNWHIVRVRLSDSSVRVWPVAVNGQYQPKYQVIQIV